MRGPVMVGPFTIRAGLSGLMLAIMLAGCAETGREENASKPADPAIAALPVPQTGSEGAGSTATERLEPALESPEAEAGTEDETAGKTLKPAPTSPAAEAAPHIYMALQPDAGGPVSVVFAIDQSRDNTPSDDPAIRITPMDGQCNPQQLRWHEFSAEESRRPSYGPNEAARGITAQDLPAFMATLVTSEMLEAGLISDPEESKPQNVCTQKLLQQMIIAESS